MVRRLNAQRFLLTYSQVSHVNVDFTLNGLADYLFSKGTASAPIDWVEVCREYHEDGNPHYHAVVTFDGRYQGRVDAFNFRGINADVKPIKDSKHDLYRSRLYLVKCLPGGDKWNPLEHDLDTFPDYEEEYVLQHFTTRGGPPMLEPPAADSKTTKRDKWHEIVSAADQQDFMAQLKEKSPKSYVTRYFDMLKFAQEKFNTPGTYVPEYPRGSFINVPPEADNWVEEVFGEVSICHPARMARTSLIFIKFTIN